MCCYDFLSQWLGCCLIDPNGVFLHELMRFLLTSVLQMTAQHSSPLQGHRDDGAVCLSVTSLDSNLVIFIYI